MIKPWILSASLILSTQLNAAPVDELVDIVGGKGQIQQMHSQIVQMMAASNPALKEKVPVIQAWAEKYFTWEALKSGLIPIYQKHFTEQEIAELVAFYQTPIGKKSIALMPTLFAEGAQVGQEIAIKYQPQLIEMLQAKAPAAN